MTECQRNIVSEDYADFIIEVGYQENRIREEWQDYCIQQTRYSYDIAYAPIQKMEPITMEKYTYPAIPKLFGLMDTTATEATGAIKLQKRKNQSLTGAGVIVGIIDTGIDYRNPIFMNATGQSRILSIWDQEDQTGEPPAGILYGSEYTRKQINEALQSENPYELVPSRDRNGHGTFMAGIACGSEDIENDFIGTANESLISVVKLKQAKQYLKDYFVIEDTQEEVYQENDIMLAVMYLTQLSRQEEKPLVIVLGVGSANGERAGGSVLSQMLNYYGQMIGNCVVVCSGNEGNERLHYEGNLLDKPYDEVELRVGENSRGFSLELWGRIPDILSVEFVTPSGELLSRIPARIGISTRIDLLLERTTIDVHYSLAESRSGMELIFMRFVDPIPGVWLIRVYSTNVLNGHYHIWMPLRQFVDEDTYFLKSDPDVTLTTPAATDSVIAVAAYNHVNQAIYADSGRGFTRIGVIKPDITGPGVEVFGPGIYNNYVKRTGTSVSTALVAGNCAQLMQWGIVQGNIPEMKTNYIKNFLILGAVRDREIDYPSTAWGYGKVNLYETFQILTRS